MMERFAVEDFSKKIDSWYCSWRDICYAGPLSECLKCVEFTAWEYSQVGFAEILLRCQIEGEAYGGSHADDTNWEIVHESLMPFEEGEVA
jgi:hypothetical protein